MRGRKTQPVGAPIFKGWTGMGGAAILLRSDLEIRDARVGHVPPQGPDQFLISLDGGIEPAGRCRRLVSLRALAPGP